MTHALLAAKTNGMAKTEQPQRLPHFPYLHRLIGLTVTVSERSSSASPWGPLSRRVQRHRRVLETDVQIKTGVLEPRLALDVLVATLAGVAGAAGPATRRRSLVAG